MFRRSREATQGTGEGDERRGPMQMPGARPFCPSMRTAQGGLYASGNAEASARNHGSRAAPEPFDIARADGSCRQIRAGDVARGSTVAVTVLRGWIQMAQVSAGGRLPTAEVARVTIR